MGSIIPDEFTILIALLISIIDCSENLGKIKAIQNSLINNSIAKLTDLLGNFAP